MDAVLVLLLIFVLILLIMAVFLVLTLGIRIRTMALYGGAPYVASTHSSINNALALANLSASDRFADLGCGDGQVVLAAAKRDVAEAVGFEIDPLLAREASKKTAGYTNAKIIRTSFWEADLTRFDVVYLFQIPYAMPRLEKKLMSELKPTARVVSNGFKFPNWKPTASQGTISLYTRAEIPKTTDAA
ncbi:class I SAM-dependent methyltransferase [Candidatus Uhrbacteria bacterium]|nr:class I SAM-dependent methyltransferase [Candidatus Uhrbacteria bacterium]